MEESEIAEWYAGQNVFITGATGFMGKILVEKLLRSCPKIANLYILIRSKRGKEAKQRLEDFLNCEVFDRIRDQPNSDETFGKLHCISGDVAKPNCNLSDEDQTLLRNNITLVFHMAANVRFDQPLKNAVLLNVGGTLNVLELACSFEKLKVFVHVSTSYCHCDETKLEERLYKAPHNPRQILELAKSLDEDILNHLTAKLLGNSPNTYAYTKCLTEQLISEYSEKLPIVITRPSIVTAVSQEPIPGWIDNINGPTGIIVGAGKGVIRTMQCNIEFTVDIVPVDMSINSLLIIAWKVGNEARKSKAEVYHITANNDQLITWGEGLELSRKYVLQYPFSVCLWYPGGGPKRSYLVHRLAVIFFHLIPAYFIDFMMRLTGNKPFMVRIQDKIQNGLIVLEYYTTRPWKFHNEKLTNLYDSLSQSDKKIFYTNRDKLNFDEYFKNYILGVRKYCLHEDLDTLPYARRTQTRLYYLDLVTNIIFYVLLLWLFVICATSCLTKIEDPYEFMDSTSLQHQYSSIKSV